MQEDAADTPCKKVYFLVQCMYLASSPERYHEKYFSLVKEVQHASPSSAFFFMQINEEIISGNYYKALKLAKQLIAHEEELLKHATQPAAE